MDDTAKDDVMAKNSALVRDEPVKSSTQAKRLDAIEVTLVYLEDMVDTLNQVVAAQDRQLTQQQRIIKKLAQKLDATKLDDGINTFDAAAEVPPHY